MSSRAQFLSMPPWGRPQLLTTDPHPASGDHRDLVVVGTGFTGLTAAVRAAEAGATVTLLSNGRPRSAALPGWSTPLHGEDPHQIRLLHGEPAVGGWVAQLARAAEHLETSAGDLGVKVEQRDFGLSTFDGQWAFQLRFIARALRIGGLRVDFDDRSGLPFPLRPELVVVDGGEIDPTRWLDALTRRAIDLGVRVVPGQLAGLRVRRGMATVETGSARLHAGRVILASSAPLADRALLRPRVRTEQWHLVAFRTETFPHRELQVLDRPQTVLARHAEHLVVGQRGGAATQLLDWVGRRFPDNRITHGWSATTTRSIDALPLVGSASLSGETVLTASGLGQYGLSLGTAAGLQLADVVLGRSRAGELPWRPARGVTANGLSKRLRSAAIGPIPFITRLNTPPLRD
ncbi:NAD(P)/FAD-dependent oxidoreductase [Naumannella halotolerans]|uniref:Glycine/D-amino acid oxidase-like deaminating enzyme n=1 Tax=Naumannella halotolerans TaxID=993414 RepID=A0A4R7J701_9ACTN|nr:FAD-binding oxidoreductase [Naumannella halotolerans]TDT32506.1 glycine/D-amino acid oxidase-like deaminating enzyme [Naumannella halotolerans]